MKKTLKKFLIIMLVILLLNNYIFSNVVLAAGPIDFVGDALGKIATTLVGIISWIPRVFALFVADGISELIESVVYTDNPADEPSGRIIGPQDILFNKAKIVDINFFDISNDDTSIVMNIRTGVATWYYTMRLIASVILLAILVYVGIRMAISTVAADRALYKKMLVDWAVSLSLIYLLHYIIIGVIYINNSLVSIIQATGAESEFTDSVKEIARIAHGISVNSMAATFVYCLLVWQTLGLFISYFSRMLKLAFLIIIAPLITITYSIDKMGDGKAQALNAWLKEFSFGVLIQPFHCIIYASLVSVSLNILAGGQHTLAAGMISILCIKFIREAEDLVRKIFSFADDNKNTSLQAGAATAIIGMKYAKSVGKTAGSFAGKAVNVVRNAPDIATNIAADAYAIATAANSGGKSFSERKDEYITNQYNKEADKDEEKYTDYKEKEFQERLSNASSTEEREKIENEQKKYKADFNNKIEAQAVALQRNNPSMSKSRAMAQARRDIAKQHRKTEKMKNEKGVIRTFRGAINNTRDVIDNSEIIKSLGGYAKASAGATIAIFGSAGSYSDNGNLFNAIGTGVAAYSATNASIDEFFKQTGTTLMRNAMPSFVSMGITNSNQLLEAINKVQVDHDDFTDEKKLEDLMQELRELLKEDGKSEKIAQQFSREIQQAIAKGEVIDQQAQMKLLAGNNVDPKVLEGAKKLSDHLFYRNIANIMDTARDMGMSESAISGRFMSSMTDSSYKTAEKFHVEIKEKPVVEEAKMGEVDFSQMEYQDKEKAIDNMEYEIDKLEVEYNKRMAADIDSDVLKDYLRNLEDNKRKAEIELKQEYERNAREIAEELSNAQKELSDEETYSMARRVKNKEELIRELDRQKREIERDLQEQLDAKNHTRTVAERRKVLTKIKELQEKKDFYETNSEKILPAVDEANEDNA